jgi:hypothetical protein
VRILPLLDSPLLNSRRAPIFSSRFLFYIFIALFSVTQSALISSAQTPEDAVRGLARRVAEIHDAPEKLSVEWTNASSLPEAESILLREAFLKELSSRRPIASPEAPAALLQVAVRETPTDFLLVARLPAAAGEEVRMARVARTSFLPVMARGSGLRLAKQLLWQQPETILDAVEVVEIPSMTSSGAGTAAANSTTDLLVLKPDALVIYRDGEDRLTEFQELPFGGYKYASRALRGEVRRGKDGNGKDGSIPDGNIEVTLPGLNCAAHGPATARERWSMQCAPAALPPPASSPTSVTPSTEVAGEPKPVTLTSTCDATSWRLVTEASDWTQPDRLLLVNAQMKREEAVAALDFAGPVRRITSTEDGSSALAVVFNLSSGSYEIYRITMVCGR